MAKAISRLLTRNFYAFSISSGCISTLTSLALTPAGDCLNIAGLISLATLSSSSSIVPSIDTWVTGLCAITSPSKCTNSTLLALGTNITDSCGSDITNAGIPSDIVNQLPELLQQYYAVGIEAFCTREYVFLSVGLMLNADCSSRILDLSGLSIFPAPTAPPLTSSA